MRGLPATTVLVAALGCAGVLVPRSAVAHSPREAEKTRSAIARSPRVAARTTRGAAADQPGPPFAVGERTITLVDASRTVRFPGRPAEPRTLVTVIRYPAQGPRSGVEERNAPPARAGGPFPLVIFGHGFAVTPAPYARLLRAWARAGYVVAAPIFPLENAHAPGGPDESDLLNEPRDMSFVITQMLALDSAPQSFLSGLIAPDEIAVSGHSDGAETALAVAYNRHFLDRRVRAAVILSGAEVPGIGGYNFPAPSPPLLAAQGTADTSNEPKFTYAFFDAAPRPKFLLSLIGARHLPPYTTEEPQLGIVERVTIDFFNEYLKNGKRALNRMLAAGNVRGAATIQADP